MLVLPSTMAPAALRRATTGASACGTKDLSSGGPGGVRHSRHVNVVLDGHGDAGQRPEALSLPAPPVRVPRAAKRRVAVNEDEGVELVPAINGLQRPGRELLAGDFAFRQHSLNGHNGRLREGTLPLQRTFPRNRAREPARRSE